MTNPDTAEPLVCRKPTGAPCSCGFCYEHIASDFDATPYAVRSGIPGQPDGHGWICQRCRRMAKGEEPMSAEFENRIKYGVWQKVVTP